MEKNKSKKKPSSWVEAQGFEEFTGGRLDEAGKFSPPTPEQEQQMNERLSRLSEMLRGAEFPWLLDGALNISLYGNDFIRYHKDLDLTVFRNDVGRLIQRLQVQGLAIAVSRQDKGKVLFRLATGSDFRDTSRIFLGIVAVDGLGKIDLESKDAMHYADLHIHDTDPDGNILLENAGVTLPKKYVQPQMKRLASGQEVKLSHPVLVAFHKLHMDRPYDEADLLRIRPYLSQEDVGFLKSALHTEIQNSLEQAKQFLFGLWEKIHPMASQGEAVISNLLRQEPLIKGRLREPNVRQFVQAATRVFATQPQVTADEFIQQVIHFHQQSALLQRKLDFLNTW